MKLMLLGATAMACFTIALLLARSWTSTRDRFFLFFAAAFIVEGIDRIVLGLTQTSDQSPLIYLIRLLSFLLIVIAVIDKNRSMNGP
jgi:uncharacterized membrane protein HdeD (DUF308 family)